MNDSKRRHVFISHHHKDDDHVSGITDLTDRHGYNIRNSSIRKYRPENQERIENGKLSDETIKRLLRRKISWASTVMVLVGEETYSRPWVNWEIQEAERQGKRIVGVWAQGAKEADLPTNLKKFGDIVVGWQSSRIIDALDGKVSEWEKPDGGRWPPLAIPRIACQ